VKITGVGYGSGINYDCIKSLTRGDGQTLMAAGGRDLEAVFGRIARA
jgi:hypothetical protein